MIKGAIFDLDGTILDSMFIWDNIGDEYLKSLGIQPKENLRETFKTFSLYQTACYFKSEYGVKLSARKIMRGINKMVEDYYINTVILKKDVLEFLDYLKSNGVKMCIATVTDKYLVKAALKRCGADKYFSRIFTCSSVGKSKEEPDIYRKALKYLKVKKCETVVFEDSLYAAKTAKNDGFLVAGVFDVHEKSQKELKALSDFYITDYSRRDIFI